MGRHKWLPPWSLIAVPFVSSPSIHHSRLINWTKGILSAERFPEQHLLPSSSNALRNALQEMKKSTTNRYVKTLKESQLGKSRNQIEEHTLRHTHRTEHHGRIKRRNTNTNSPLARRNILIKAKNTCRQFRHQKPTASLPPADVDRIQSR